MKSFLSTIAAIVAMESSSTQRQSFNEPEPIPLVEYGDYRPPFKKARTRHRKKSSIALRRKRNKIARKSRQINRS